MVNARAGATSATEAFSASASAPSSASPNSPSIELLRAEARGQQVFVLGDGGADEHAGARTIERLVLVARVLDRLARRFDREAVLRVHHLHAARGEAVVQRRELVDAVDERALADVGLVDRAHVVGIEERGVLPAGVVDVLERDVPGADQLPAAQARSFA